MRGGRATVRVARGTYADRYDDATIDEYEPVADPGAWNRRLDVLRAPLGLARSTAGPWAAALADQDRWEPSVVILHNAPQAVGLVARPHTPVLYAHNELFRTYTQREAGRVIGDVGAVVCVSDFLAERTADRLPRALRDRVHVIRNGVDTARFRPGPAFPKGQGELHVVFVGRTIPDKGPDILLQAVELLDRADIRATVVGSAGFSATAPLTSYERQVRARADRIGRRATVLPFVPRPEVPGLLATADVVVVPSVWPDPCPLTVLEGMAAGAAIVASAVGGIPEVVGDAGALVDAGDARALADALERLAEDPRTLEAARSRARARAEGRDWAVASAELDTLLRSIRPAGAPG
nr:glycosyltransferase family 4 protein [Isoptericola chiayiensis]